MKKLLIGLVFAIALRAACPTDAKGVCIDPANATIARLIGKVAPLAASPIPYYTIAVPLVIDSLVTAALANPPTLGTAIPGVCSFTDSPATLTCPGATFMSLTPPIKLMVRWNTIDGNDTGRMYDVAHPVSDTVTTFETFTQFIPTQTNLNVNLLPAETSTYHTDWWVQRAQQTTQSWDYYGVCPSIYRHYWMTADASWLTKFRSWADIQWQWSNDHGRNWGNSRDVDLLCLFIRALDGHPERMDPVYTSQIFASTQASQDATNHVITTVQDTRERGYQLANYVVGAWADTTANGGSDAHHTAYCTLIVNQVGAAGGWIASQETNGMVDEPIFQWYLQGPYSGKQNSPWRSQVWIRALQMAYEILAVTDPLVGCNNMTLAASLLIGIGKAVDWSYEQGISQRSLGGNGYAYYDVGSPSRGQVPFGVADGAGTLAISVGSVSVVGTGTNFTGAMCDGTHFLDVSNLESSLNHKSVYKIASCADTTHLTLTQIFGTYGESVNTTNASTCLGGNSQTACYMISDPSYTTCAQLSASYCEAVDLTPPIAEPNLIRDFAGQQGWMWIHSGDVKYKTRGDELFAKATRGPSDGPYGAGACGGTITCYGGGTNDELGVNCNAGLLTRCKDGLAQALGSSCGYACGDGPFVALGKTWGQFAGFPCTTCYVAYRLMDPLPVAGKLVITGSPKFTGHPVVH